MLNIILINIFLVFATVAIHYEVLSRLSLMLPKMQIFPRTRVAIGLLGALCAHAAEIWIYALVYYILIQLGGYGGLSGITDQSLMDCGYLSFTTYSSLGYGDIFPLGDLRFIAGLQALVGLIMIAWTASFIYLEMEKFWGRN